VVGKRAEAQAPAFLFPWLVNVLTLALCGALYSFQSPPLVYYISGAFFSKLKASRRSWSVSADCMASGYMVDNFPAP